MDTTAASALRLRYLAYAGLAAGTLDLIYICTLWAFRDVGPIRILHSVAAGWLGRDAAVTGGHATAALGLVSHYGIAVAMAGAYGLAARRWPALVRRPLACGAGYGIVLYLVMNFIVVPLSAAGSAPVRLEWIQLAHLGAHMLLVGVPCAYGAAFALRGDGAPARRAERSATARS